MDMNTEQLIDALQAEVTALRQRLGEVETQRVRAIDQRDRWKRIAREFEAMVEGE